MPEPLLLRALTPCFFFFNHHDLQKSLINIFPIEQAIKKNAKPLGKAKCYINSSAVLFIVNLAWKQILLLLNLGAEWTHSVRILVQWKEHGFGFGETRVYFQLCHSLGMGPGQINVSELQFCNLHNKGNHAHPCTCTHTYTQPLRNTRCENWMR